MEKPQACDFHMLTVVLPKLLKMAQLSEKHINVPGKHIDTEYTLNL